MRNFSAWPVPKQIIVASGDVVWATGDGTLDYNLCSTDGSCTDTKAFTLHNVSYDPEIKSCIISVSALSKIFTMVFCAHGCSLWDHAMASKILTIPCVDGLYSLQLRTSPVLSGKSAPVEFFYHGSPFQNGHDSYLTSTTEMLSSSMPDQYPDPATLMIPVDIIDSLFSSVPVQDSGSGLGMTPADSRKSPAVGFSLDCRNFLLSFK